MKPLNRNWLFGTIILFSAMTAHASAPDCLEKCEKSKDRCMAQYTKSDSTSGKYVTPDGHKICWGSYHECKKYCPKPSKK